jgi:hypothetical protein
MQVAQSASAFNRDIGSWNVASVSNMFNLFLSALSFNQNLAGWNVARVTNFTAMWTSATALSDCNKQAMYTSWGTTFVGGWPTFNVVTCTVGSLCVTCITDGNVATAVTAWLGGDATTYGNISDWDVSAVSNMYQLFYTKSAFNADISRWNVASATGLTRFLSGASAFDQNLTGWNVLRVANVTSAFDSATALSNSTKGAMYLIWGATLQSAYPNWSCGNIGMPTCLPTPAPTPSPTPAPTASPSPSATPSPTPRYNHRTQYGSSQCLVAHT